MLKKEVVEVKLLHYRENNEYRRNAVESARNNVTEMKSEERYQPIMLKRLYTTSTTGKMQR
jgi:hypothetical protein